MTLNAGAVNRGVARLGLMAFFPGDPDTRAAMVWAFMQLVETEAQLDWLIERALKLYSRWPGITELRALYCSRYRPKDGGEAYSEIYVRGFPHESPETVFAEPPRGAPMTADAEFQAKIQSLATVKQMPKVGRRAK